MNPQAIYEQFKSKVGSEHIAWPETLRAVVSACKNAKYVLELGGGIGTISYAVLSNSDAELDVYEHNTFCRNELEKNLKEFKERYTLLDSYNMLPPKREYDVIIVDGGKGQGPKDGGFPALVGAYLMTLRSIKTIIIDGNRHSQLYYIMNVLRNEYKYTITRVADGTMGCRVIICTPQKNDIIRSLYHWMQKLKV